MYHAAMSAIVNAVRRHPVLAAVFALEVTAAVIAVYLLLTIQGPIDRACPDGCADVYVVRV